MALGIDLSDEPVANDFVFIRRVVRLLWWENVIRVVETRLFGAQLANRRSKRKLGAANRDCKSSMKLNDDFTFERGESAINNLAFFLVDDAREFSFGRAHDFRVDGRRGQNSADQQQVVDDQKVHNVRQEFLDLALVRQQAGVSDACKNAGVGKAAGGKRVATRTRHHVTDKDSQCLVDGQVRNEVQDVHPHMEDDGAAVMACEQD